MHGRTQIFLTMKKNLLTGVLCLSVMFSSFSSLENIVSENATVKIDKNKIKVPPGGYSL